MLLSLKDTCVLMVKNRFNACNFQNIGSSSALNQSDPFNWAIKVTHPLMFQHLLQHIYGIIRDFNICREEKSNQRFMKYLNGHFAFVGCIKAA